MKIATWNVNGIRARGAQVMEWLASERPDVVCLQELKATPEQVPADLAGHPEYWAYWHGARAYSGVALLVRKDLAPDRPAFTHPAFDHETRIVVAEVAGLAIASVYVPNGGKEYAPKVRFLEALADLAAEHAAGGKSLVLCGDLNVAHREIDVHPKERKPTAIGQLPEERALFDRLLGRGLVDIGRVLNPVDEQYFTWWAPWRGMRQRNIGWRLDYVLASPDVAGTAVACPAFREVGTSDHGPVVATFDRKTV
jgi:exodeoxyribonuclease-3